MTNRELETRYTQMKLAWKNLVDANIDLVDENKMLKGEIERLKDVIKNKHLKEIERLNNIINELEKLLKEEKTRTRYANDVERFTAYDFVLKKLQELKGDE